MTEAVRRVARALYFVTAVIFNLATMMALLFVVAISWGTL